MQVNFFKEHEKIQVNGAAIHKMFQFKEMITLLKDQMSCQCQQLKIQGKKLDVEVNSKRSMLIDYNTPKVKDGLLDKIKRG